MAVAKKTESNVHESVTQPKVGPGEPGFALGLAGFISSFVAGIVGIVLSAIALSQSKRVGKGNTFAFAGLIIGIVTTVLGLLATIGVTLATIGIVNYCNNNPDQCMDNSGSNSSQNSSGDGSSGNQTY